MSMSRLDQLYRRLLLTKFFTHGWGKPDNLKRLFAFRKILSNRETCQHLVSPNYPIEIDKEYRDNGCKILEGHFTSPFVHHLPGIMPKEVETASFQVILPESWQHPTLKPVCIHLAGTGDHYFWRRRIFTARPLLKETGIASILLENPYYGTRKPKQQLRSSLHNVSDLFVMGGALVLESLALLHWCEREGWGPLGISGISMGGHMASLAATNWTKPLALIPCLSWSTASCVFTEGVMSGAIPWQTLQEQFFENSVYQEEIRQLIISPEDKRRKAYDMGQQFVKDYSANVEQVESLHKLSGDGKTKKPDIFSTHLHTVRSSNESKLHSKGKHEWKKTDDIMSPNDYLSHIQSETLSVGQNVSFTGKQKLQLPSVPLKDTEANIDSIKPSAPHQPVAAPLSVLLTSISHNNIGSKPVSVSHDDISSKPVSVSHNDIGSKPVSVSHNDIGSKPVSLNVQTWSQPMKTTSKTSSLGLKFAFSKSRLTKTAQIAGEEQVKKLQQEALDFMRGVMDECTHLGNFSVPVDPELIIIVSAKQDAYVPKEGVLGLDVLWPGCEVRLVNDGHVGAVLWHQSVFRKAIADAFDRQVQKYYKNSDHQTINV